MGGRCKRILTLRAQRITKKRARRKDKNINHDGLDPAGERRGTGGHDGRINLKEQNVKMSTTKGTIPRENAAGQADTKERLKCKERKKTLWELAALVVRNPGRGLLRREERPPRNDTDSEVRRLRSPVKRFSSFEVKCDHEDFVELGAWW